MENQEYRLRTVNGEFADNEREVLKRVADVIKDNNLDDSEAVYADGVIFLPGKKKITEPSTLTINKVKKKRIDHTTKIHDKKLHNTFRKIQKEKDLLQKDMIKIAGEFNKLQKLSCETDKKSEEEIKLLEEIANNVVKENNQTKYLNDIERHCKGLTSCLCLDNPEVLTEETKKDVTNKLNVLQTFIDDFRNKV